MRDNYVLSFRKGISLDDVSDDQIVLQSEDKRFHLKSLAPWMHAAILMLSRDGATEDELARIAHESGDDSSIAQLYYFIQMFGRHRMILHSLQSNGTELATLEPLSAHFEFAPKQLDPLADYSLSQFAYLHKNEGEFVLESPLSHAKITLHGWQGAALVAELAEPRTVESLCGLLPAIPPDAVSLFLQMLLGADFIFERKAEALYPEGELLAQWDFHDLLFHARSRLGRHANGYGGTYRFQGKLAPLPAVKPKMSDEAMDLYKPDLEKLEQEDYPFSLVLEHRVSIREYGDNPITDRQLGEFLYRSARVKEIIERDVQDLTKRPSPGGGAIHELELYLTVKACAGILPGLYHYCPKNHRLHKISEPNKDVQALLEDALRSSGMERIQILITIAARFQRFSWKYESLAYSTILKNVGSLFQTMYLVATAMDLAPCALGGGDSDVFAQAARLNYYEETSVGEFVLGSKRISSGEA